MWSFLLPINKGSIMFEEEVHIILSQSFIHSSMMPTDLKVKL